MSNNQEFNTIAVSNNNVIYENLTKIYEKLFLVKNSFNFDEDDEY
jgi:hypothetical protein